MHDAKQQYSDKTNFVIKKVKEAIKESASINKSGYEERSLSLAVSQVYKFVYEVQKNDIVIIPSENSDEICIGIFTEDHLADSQQTNENFVYTRKVKWVKQLEKDTLILSFTSYLLLIMPYVTLVTIKNISKDVFVASL